MRSRRIWRNGNLSKRHLWRRGLIYRRHQQKSSTMRGRSWSSRSISTSTSSTSMQQQQQQQEEKEEEQRNDSTSNRRRSNYSSSTSSTSSTNTNTRAIAQAGPTCRKRSVDILLCLLASLASSGRKLSSRAPERRLALEPGPRSNRIPAAGHAAGQRGHLPRAWAQERGI